MALASTTQNDEATSLKSSRRIVMLVNLAHAIDHFSLLIYPTAVIALAQETGLDYSALIALSTGAFVAFGVLSLPVGFIANHIGRRRMMTIFFFGIAFACAGMATANSNLSIMVWLLLLGSFAAIYHPVGSALIVAHAPDHRLGRTLGMNGVWGNIGAASAPLITATLAHQLGWRAAFIGPALVAALAGILFLLLVPKIETQEIRKTHKASQPLPHRFLYLTAACFMIAIACGGTTFNIISVALPKVIDERLGLPLPLQIVGSLATIIFIFGALTQLNVGRLIEKQPLPRLFMIISLFQPLGFLIASLSTGIPLLIGLVFTIAAIYGNVVVIDAIVARYIPDHLRSRAYGIRYFLGFAASGFAVPLIAWSHDKGGFPLVLDIGAGFGLALFVSTIVTWRMMNGKTAQA